LDAAGIFKENCARCHGDAGLGTDKGISLVKGHALHHPEGDFIRQVTDGEKDKMPSFKDKLSEEEIKAVVRYVREVIQGGKGGSHQH
jgi:mono/diheme cytochrome c family protein